MTAAAGAGGRHPDAGPDAGPAAALRRRASGPRAGDPLLTVYGDGGSRVELSATTAALWAAKVAGLLEDLGLGPGDVVGLVAGSAWTSWVALLGASEAGCDVVVLDDVPDDGDGPGAAELLGGLLVDEAAAAARGTPPPGLPAAVALGHHPLTGRCTAPVPDWSDLAEEAAVMPDQHPPPARAGALRGASATAAAVAGLAARTDGAPVVLLEGLDGAVAAAALLDVGGARAVWWAASGPVDPSVLRQERVTGGADAPLRLTPRP